ncbi:hypothetical protein BPOR_0033g00010 [Botrytis porri]|uniref:Uncharacterized protein n=1 Tax=Botrytis porri TaxID=87229 RepID=A0A4Z1L3A7_9HELO|nr:hypothetical protein BPOR_0033g00010 [Botrytis porri]
MPISQSSQDIVKAETLARKIRRTERDVLPYELNAERQEKIDWLSYRIGEKLCSHSESSKYFSLRGTEEISLILIATRDDDEFNTIWELFKSTIGSHGYTPITLRMKLKHTPELRNQSYGFEAAMKHFSTQIQRAIGGYIERRV